VKLEFPAEILAQVCCIATSVTTMSSGTLLSQAQDQTDSLGQSSPACSLGLQMGSPLFCQAVKLGVTPAVRLLPIGFDEPSIFQSMQGGVQGTARHLDNVAGDLLQPLRDGITMHRLDGDDFQNEKIQSTLGEIGSRRGIGYSFHFYLYYIPA
jgi:hypothetical protein